MRRSSPSRRISSRLSRWNHNLIRWASSASSTPIEMHARSWTGIGSILDVASRLGDVRWCAQIAPIVLIGRKGHDPLSLRRETDVAVNDGEGAIFRNFREDARRDDVNSGKGRHARPGHRMDRWILSGIDRPRLGFCAHFVLATEKLAVFVEDQGARCVAVLNRQRGERICSR